jgi:hypothetical protein
MEGVDRDADPVEMKTHHKLQCDNLTRIQEQVLAWVKHQGTPLPESRSLWNKIHTPDLLAHSPALVEYFQTLGLKVREVAMTVINKHEDVGLHIDELPVTAKINIPISNTENSFNRWYRVPGSLMDETAPIVNEFGKKYYTFENVDYSKLELIDELELTGPAVFNSQIAHNIVVNKDCALPRLVLACTFFKEPLHYLED